MNNLYETNRFFLRVFTERDIKPHYLSWFSDREVTKYTSHGAIYTKDQAIKFLDNARFLGDIILMIIVKRIAWSEESKKKLDTTGDNKRTHIGNIALQNFDKETNSAEFAGIIGEKDYWNKCIGTDAIRLLFNHGFKKLKLDRIWLGTPVTNQGMIHVARKLGMQGKGALRNHIILEGKRVDVIRYGISRSEWIEADINQN